MNYDTYKDRVYGCWLGKMIAGNIGGPLEDCREIMDFQSLHEIAPDEMMVNDDLDVQLIWLNVLLEKGWELTSDDLMEAFIAHYPYGPNEYGYGIFHAFHGLSHTCGNLGQPVSFLSGKGGGIQLYGRVY